MAMLDHALDLARRGFRVFPLIPGTKRPAIEKWQERATTDEAIIRKAWAMGEYNIGIATGQGLVVLDVDVKDGKPGMDSLASLHLDLETYTVETPSGGLHVYYRGPDVSNSAGRIGPGLDVRSAGGYVVGVGSICEDRPYKLVRNGGCRDASESFIARCGDPKGNREHGVRSAITASAEVELDDAATVVRGRDWLRNEASLAEEHRGGDHTTLTVAMRLKDFGISEDVAFELMLDHWNERCEPPWLPDDLKIKVENAYRYGQNAPGSAHPAAIFGDVKIDAAPPVKTAAPSKWFRHGDAYNVQDAAWTFYDMLPDVGVALIVGPPNSGKTFLELEMARCLATSKPFFGVEPDEKGGTVFLFAGTEGSAFPRRLAALEEASPLPISARAVSDLSGRGALAALHEILLEEAALMQVLHGVPLRMVVLETLSASGLLNDENSNAEAGRAMANLGRLAEMLGILFVTTHHPPKERQGSRGAGAITASADYVIELTRDGQDTMRHVNLVKARDAEQRMLGTFTLVPVHLGTDRKGRPVKSMSVSMGDAMHAARSGGRAPKLMVEFMRAVDFADTDHGGELEGERVIPKAKIDDHFEDLTPNLDRSNRFRSFKKLMAYALDMGVLEQRNIHGVHYIVRKEITT